MNQESEISSEKNSKIPNNLGFLYFSLWKISLPKLPKYYFFDAILDKTRENAKKNCRGEENGIWQPSKMPSQEEPWIICLKWRLYHIQSRPFLHPFFGRFLVLRKKGHSCHKKWRKFPIMCFLFWSFFYEEEKHLVIFVCTFKFSLF